MIVLCKLIAGVSYYTNYSYNKLDEIVEQQMKLMITEKGVDVIQAISEGKLVASITKASGIRYTDYGRSLLNK